MVPARWLADAMLGRLARHLRFVGLDTEYARDLDDDTIVAWARREERFLLTRDYGLARRVPAGLLLRRSDIEGQWRELVHRFPDLPREPVALRCPRCNGRLSDAPSRVPADSPLLPAGVVARGIPVVRCEACGHPYWWGSHPVAFRERLAAWTAPEVP